MTTEKAKGRFSKAPDLSTLLESKEAQDFIKSGEAVENQPAPATEKKVANVKPTAKPKNNAKTVDANEEYDWMTIDPKLKVQHIVRLPAQLKQLILYLGDTGKGQNQTSISVEGLTKIAETLAKERGLPLPKSWGEWLKNQK